MTLPVRRIENARQEHHLRIRYDRGVEEFRRHIRVINAETSLRTLRAKIGRNLFPRPRPGGAINPSGRFRIVLDCEKDRPQ